MSEKVAQVMLAQQELVRPANVWLTFLLLGWSYGSLGKVGLQILFYTDSMKWLRIK